MTRSPKPKFHQASAWLSAKLWTITKFYRRGRGLAWDQASCIHYNNYPITRMAVYSNSTPILTGFIFFQRRFTVGTYARRF
jgi:hypothetical protein